jgi:transglycosylase-like protein with SLT domain
MSRLPWRWAPRPAAVGTPAWRGAAAYGAMVAVLAAAPLMLDPNPPQISTGPAPAAVAHTSKGPAFRQIILPDLAVIEPQGLSAAHVTGLSRLAGVRDVLAVDGAAITVHGRRVNVIGVNAQQFRSWTPLATASSQRLWAVLDNGGFVSSRPARRLLRLRPGGRYRLAGASAVTLAYGGAASLGIAGVDVVVSSRESAPLGLVRNVAALISAPGVKMSALKREVRATLGAGGTLVSLRQPQLPVNPATPSGRPSNYLELFQASAARYCPGMSWTVLAAIGQIESGDGANNGPSSAGALGPMQFLPSTWAAWGITAFGEPGPPNIMDPYDAVPSAARMLCADGGGTPAGLPGAIFAYNHANWYVAEVLALAKQYAQAYG